MRNIILLLALAVSLGACASNEPQSAASAEGEQKTESKCGGESTSSRLKKRGC